jgi:hypothetical protein
MPGERVLFCEATSYGSCGVLKTPLEAPWFNADRLVVSEDQLNPAVLFPAP